MRRILTLSAVLLALALEAPLCRAQFGWPPPGYSVASSVAPDGSHYRGLCQLLRDRRQARKGDPAKSVPAPVAVTVPAPQPVAPATLP